jgi:hypothetical protein
LESLAKGAVCFSRKFTLQEIQDRWNSLLYDPEISTQASSRMAEYENELSTSDPSKAQKLFNSKAKDFAFQKRKIDSVKNLYYAMRKRICNHPCSNADLGFLVTPCSCMSAGGECLCGGLPKLSQGQHIINNIEPGMSSVSRYGQVSASYNGEHLYPEMNGHSFHTKHVEGMASNGDPTNIVPYGFSDSGQIIEHHAYRAKNHGNSEGNNASHKGMSDFQDSMQFQHLDSNQCGNGVAESKTLVIPNQVGVDHVHFNNNVREPMHLQVSGQLEGSQPPDGAIWSRIHARDTLTFSDDKKIKSENRDSHTFQATIDGGICTSDLEHTEMPETDFIDFPFFNNTDDFMLNGENFLNSPSEANQEDLDDPDSKVVPGVGSTMQTLVQPNENNMSSDQIDPGHVKTNLADVSTTILVSGSLEVPCPGQYFECVLNTEDPEIPCNDDVATTSEYPQCSSSVFGQNSENAICSAAPATSPRSNPEHSKSSDVAPIKVEDMSNVQPPLQTMKLSPSTSEPKEGSVGLSTVAVQGAKPSEVASTDGVLVTCNIDMTDADSCMLALPSFVSAGFGEGSPCSFGQRGSFDNSHDLTLQNSVQVPDQMQYSPHDNQQELGDEAALPNCMPSNGLSDLGIQDHVATLPTSVQAEICSDNENDVPNFYDLESLVLIFSLSHSIFFTVMLGTNH